MSQILYGIFLYFEKLFVASLSFEFHWQSCVLFGYTTQHGACQPLSNHLKPAGLPWLNLPFSFSPSLLRQHGTKQRALGGSTTHQLCDSASHLTSLSLDFPPLRQGPPPSRVVMRIKWPITVPL